MFCDSQMPMSMYMDGFQFTFKNSNNPCLVFLSKNYVLDTPIKFIVAIILMYLIGITSNLILHHTSKVVKNINSNVHNNNVCTVEVRLFFLQILNGMVTYVLMLIVMTYSIELLLSIALGEATGGLLLLMNFEGKYKSIPTIESAENKSLLEHDGKLASYYSIIYF